MPYRYLAAAESKSGLAAGHCVTAAVVRIGPNSLRWKPWQLMQLDPARRLAFSVP
jgi:hypothetical protein